MNKIIVIDKPAGISSRKVVDQVMRRTGARKAGHAGTLDPFATGVLPVCLGRTTKLIPYIRSGEKKYIATLRLGMMTDTLDITGKIQRCEPCKAFPAQRITELFSSMEGDYTQVIPAYSARKIGGKRSYALARAGNVVSPGTNQVRIHRLRLLHYVHPVIQFEVVCSEGTYVRSLGADVARKLGTPGILTSLRRTQSGPYRVESSVHLKKLSDIDFSKVGIRGVFPPESAVPDLDRITLDDSEAFRFRNGVAIPVSISDRQPVPGECSVFHCSGSFIGLGKIMRLKKKSGFVLKTVKLIDIKEK